MKKLTLSLISALVVLINAQIHGQFSITFRPLAWYHAPRAIAEYNGSYYAAGSGRNSQQGITQDVMYLTEFDSSGNIVYQFFSDPSSDSTNIIRHCTALEVTSNGIVMAGDSDGYFFVMGLDLFYSQLWSYKGTFGDVATEIVVTGFGYLVAGESGSVALDFNGNLLWQTTDLAYDIAQTANGFISCTRDSILELRGTDLSGNNPWTISLGITMVPQPWRAAHIAATPNNVYLAGQRIDSLFVVSTDEFGALVWQKSFSGTLFTVCELHTCPLGGLILTGSHSDSAFVMRLDNSGNVLWRYNRFLTDTFSRGWDAIQTSSGDLFWAGIQLNSFDLMGVNFAVLQADSLSLDIVEIQNEIVHGKNERFDLLGRKITDQNYEGLCIMNGKVWYVMR